MQKIAFEFEMINELRGYSTFVFVCHLVLKNLRVFFFLFKNLKI